MPLGKLDANTSRTMGKLLAAAINRGIIPVRFGLVAQSVEQCPFNSNRRILAIFSDFLSAFATIAGPLILLTILNVAKLSLVLSKNPKKFNRVKNWV